MRACVTEEKTEGGKGTERFFSFRAVYREIIPFPKSSPITSSVEIKTKRTCILLVISHISHRKLQSASEL